MPDDKLILDADATQLLAALDKTLVALQRFYGATDEAIKKTQQYNVESQKLINTWKVTADEGKSATITFAQIGKSIDATTVSVKGEEVALASLGKQLDTIKVQLAGASAKAGDFKSAMQQASSIQAPKLQAETIAKVATFQTMQTPNQPVSNVKLLAQDEQVRVARLNAIREMQLLQQQDAANGEKINQARAASIRRLQLEEQDSNNQRLIALRVMQTEQQKSAAVQTSITKAQTGYNEFLNKTNKGLVDVTAQTSRYNHENERSIEVIRGVTKAGEEITATVRKQGGQVIGFQETSNRPIEAIKAAQRQQSAAAQAQAEAQQRQTLAQKDAGGFLKDLNSNMLQTISYTKSYSSATGQLTETYNTLNKTGQQQITTITRQGEAVKGFTQVTYDQAKANEQLMLSWQSLMRIFAVQLIHQALNAMMTGIQQSVEAAKELQIQVAQIQTISESGLNVSQWVDGIRKVSDATGLLASDVASGLYDTLSNQIADGGKALEFLTAAGNFAVVTNSNLKESVNAISSAINSYGMKAEDATRISDVFFRMIDLGRITAKDFANDIGRILPGAQQLGVRLEEVAAALSVLTRAGVTPAQAMTSLFNIFSRLIKPAGEMKEFIRGLGVESGQAAIETYGFAQVLGKIAEFAQGKPELLGQLFPDIRGLRGILRLAGNGIKEFTADLKQMDDAVGSTATAMGSFTENEGKKFQIELTKIQNYFTQEWGQALLKTIAQISEAFGGLSHVVKITAETLLYLGTPTIIGGFVSLIQQSQVLKTVLSGLATPVTGFGAALAVVMIAAAQVANNYADRIETVMRKQEEAYDEAVKSGKVAIDKQLRDIDGLIQKQHQQVTGYVANVKIFVNENLQSMKDLNDKALEQLQETNDKITNYLKDKISGFKEAVSKLKKEYESLIDLQKDVPKETEQSKFKIQLDSTKDPVKKWQLLNQELEKTLTLINKAATAEQLTDLYKEAKSLAEQIQSLGIKSSKESLKDDKERDKLLKRRAELEEQRQLLIKKGGLEDLKNQDKLTKLQNRKNSTTTTVDGKLIPTDLKTGIQAQSQDIKLTTQQNKLKHINDELLEINKALREQESAQLPIIDNAATLDRIAAATLQKSKELTGPIQDQKTELDRTINDYENNLKLINRTFSDIEKFKFDKLVDPEINEKNFNKLYETGKASIEKYRELVLKYTGQDFESQATARKQLAALDEQLETAKVGLQVRLQSEAVVKQEQARIELNKKQEADFKAQLENQDKYRQAAITNLQQSVLEYDPYGAKKMKALIEELIKNPTMDSFKKVLELRAKTLESLKSQGINVTEGRGPLGNDASYKTLLDNIMHLSASVLDSTTAYNDLSTKQEDVANKIKESQSIIDTTLREQFTLKDATIDLTDGLKTETQAVEKLTGGITTLNTLMDRFINKTGAQPTSGINTTKALNLSVNTTAEDVVAASAQASANNAQATASLGATNATLIETQNRLIQVQTDTTGAITNLPERLANAIAPKIVTETVQLPPKPLTQAFGGMIHGSDNIPALLSKGEFVVNASATRRFYSQLVSMNSVRGYANGGLVTNVGDINVSMQSSGNVDTDIVAIGKGLRREIRRGRLRL